MQNWILMAQNHKGQNLRACSQIADDNIPSLEAANRLADSLELAPHPEGSRMVLADTLTMYTDSLWVLFRFLEGLQGEAKAQADHFYQERRRVP